MILSKLFCLLNLMPLKAKGQNSADLPQWSFVLYKTNVFYIKGHLFIHRFKKLQTVLCWTIKRPLAII